MDIGSIRSVVARELHDFGIGPTLYDLSFRAINHAFPCTIWNAVVIDAPRRDYLRLPDHYRGRLLDAEDMRRYVGPENDLDHAVVDQAIEKGDKCMVLLHGHKLAASGWYSSQPTDLTDELRLRFAPGYVYMYKGFTNHDYRGQRLHAIGMTLAWQEYLRLGFRGIVSVVASHNFSSLKSCYRMGYRDFGKIYFAKLLGRSFLHHSKSCESFGLLVEPKPAFSQSERMLTRVA